MCEDIHVKEQWQLLQNLRSTVEGLLIDGIANVWNVYGGLNRLHNAMEQIFKHGCRIFNSNVSKRYMFFKKQNIIFSLIYCKIAI